MVITNGPLWKEGWFSLFLLLERNLEALGMVELSCLSLLLGWLAGESGLQRVKSSLEFKCQQES